MRKVFKFLHDAIRVIGLLSLGVIGVFYETIKEKITGVSPDYRWGKCCK